MTERRQTCVGTLPGPVSQTSARSGDQWSYVFTSGTWTTLTHALANQVHNHPTVQWHRYSTSLCAGYTAWRSLPVTNVAYAACLLYVPSIPNGSIMPGNTRLISFYQAGGTLCGALCLDTLGRLCIIDSGQTVRGTGAVVPLNQWVRVALTITNPDQIWADLKGYIFTDPESTTPTETLQSLHVVTQNSITECGFGILSTMNLGTTGVNNTWEMAVADCAYSDVAMPPLFAFGNIAPPSLPTAVNLAPDPSMQSGIASAQLTGSTKYTLSYDTTVVHSGTQSAMVTRTTVALDTILCALNVTPTAVSNAVKVCAAPGQTMSFALWMRCNVANWQTRLVVVWRDSTGTILGSSVTGPTTPSNPANTWVLVKFENVTAPANAAMVTVQGVSLTPSGNAVGGELTWCDDLMISPGPVVQPYADGRTPGWSWAGQPDASLSLKGLRALTQLNLTHDPTMESDLTSSISSTSGTLWALTFTTTQKHSGTRAAALTRQAATPSNTLGALYYTPNAASPTPGRIYVTPGQVVSTGVYVRAPAATGSYRGQVTIQFRDAAGAIVGSTIPGPLIDNLPTGVWNLVASEGVVVPAGAVFAAAYCTTFLPVGGTTVGGEVTQYDSGMFNIGPKLHAYWDPTNGGAPGAVWLTGVPNWGPACRPIGPFTQWDGTLEQPLTVAGVYDGSTVQPASFASVAVV